MNSGSPYLERIQCSPAVVQVKATNTAFSRMTPVMEGMSPMDQITQNNTQLNTQINNYDLLKKRLGPEKETRQQMRDRMEMDIQEYIQHENTTLLLGGGTLTILLIATLLLVLKK
jgi:hypothetical protein